MTVEATLAPGASAEERLRARALDLLRTATLEVILASEEPLRTVDIARRVADRLDMRLSEEEAGGLASLVRMVLDSDPLFSQANRQWDLALRMGRAAGDRRKPVERALVDFIDLIGHPVPAHPVAVLAAALYGRQPDYYEQMLERLVPAGGPFFRAGREEIGIRRWLLDITSDDPEEVEWDNFEDTAALDALRPLAEGLEATDAVAFARALIEKAAGPVENRALQFLAWSRFRDVRPEALFAALWSDPDLALERGPAWTPAAERRRLVETIRALAREPEAAGALVAATLPAEEEEIGLLAPTTVRVSDEDLDQVYHLMAREPRTWRLSELLQQALEVFPGSRTYPSVRESLMARLKEDSRFQWVGFERFRLSGTLPPEIELLPEELAYDEREYLDEEGNEVDRLLDPSDWKFNLDEQVMHYLVQDIGDDSTAPGTPPERLVSSPPLHHYVAGTRYLRHCDRGFFPTEPDLVQVTFVAPDGNRFEAWVNNRMGLIFGLKEWYDANLPWIGGRFTIEHGDQPEEYRLVYTGETEPLMDLGQERLQQLLPLRGEAAEEGLPLTEIVRRILQSAPEGMHFVTLFTAVNIVRRVRRAQVASVLSAQRYFTQSPQRPGIWSYDEKRAAKAKKKGPKRPIREYEEEEELYEE